MGDTGEDPKPSVPKFSSFKGKEISKDPTAVPKFSSFKSKEPISRPSSKDESGKGSERESKESKGDRHRSDKSHRPRHHREESSRRSSDHRRRHRSSSREKIDSRDSNLESLPDRGVASNLFVVDTKGDPLIRRYGGIEKSQIPAYYRYGAGRVLGTPGRLVIYRDGARDQFGLRMPGEQLSAFRDKDGLRSRRPRMESTSLLLRSRKKTHDDGVAEDYLPIGKPKKVAKNGSNADSSDEDQRQSYRSIEGKAKPGHQLGVDSDSSEDSDSSNDLEDMTQSNPLTWKSIQLNRRVKEHPEDIDAWLELVDHQDTLLQAGTEIDQQILENAAHSYSEIKVSMLESALTNTSTPGDRKRVLVYLMREGVKVWSTKAATKKWSELSADMADNFELWKTLLDFTSSNISTFQYDDVKKMLLERLKHAISRASSDPSGDAFHEAVYVFGRTTQFIHDAGYKELAVAAWQALFEINFFRPSQPPGETINLETFQDFWESEVPRIGDSGAAGWKHFVESGSCGEAPEPMKDDAEEGISSRDVYKTWGRAETNQSRKSRMPARTMDEGTEDDPFRVVMFSDIEDLLFFIPEANLPGLSHHLIDSFLLFAGFPPAFLSGAWSEMIYRDQFLTSSLIDVDLEFNWAIQEDVDQDQARKPPSFDRDGLHGRASPSTLFASAQWFRYIAPRARERAIESHQMQRALKQLAHLPNLSDLSQYFLAFCFFTDSKTIKKPAKALLKRYNGDIELYNGYALAEYANGDFAIASKVLVSATDLPWSSSYRKFALFKTWAWMSLESGDVKIAIVRLCSSIDESLRKTQSEDAEVVPIILLKTQQAFKSKMQESLGAGDAAGAQALAECLALLSYLTTKGGAEPQSSAQGNISAAMEAFDVISREFQLFGLVKTVSHERVLQFASRLLYFNATKGPFRRIYMREHLSRFIDMYPRSTIFLSLFEWADSSLRVVDETRDLLREKVLVKEHDCVSSRVFSIHHELARGNANTTQAAFEHALASDACKNSVVLWISYIRFCRSQKQLRKKAKDVFYRALRHCPWSKAVMMEAFVTLINDMGSDELKSVYNTMTSKGLRVHIDMEDFADRKKKDQGR